MKKIEKILQYLDNQGINVATFERESNISNGYFNNTIERGADITEKILDKIRKNNSKIYAAVFQEPQPTPTPTKNSDTMEQEQDYRTKYEKLLEKTNDQLSAALETVNTMAKGIEANLNKAVRGNIAHQSLLSVNQSVMFEALDVLQNLPPGTTAKKADNARHARLPKILKKDSADI